MALALAPDTVSIITQFFFLCSIEHKKKNWLFSDSPAGATASATVYSIVEMAKSHELNIYEYIKYILSQRPSKDWSDEQLETIAPWNQDVIEKCKR